MNPPSMSARSTIEHGCGSLFSLAFNPDGTLLAGGGDIAVGPDSYPTHGVVVLWEPNSGRELRRLEVQSAPVLAVAFSPTGQLLAAGSNTPGRRTGARNALTLWAVDTGHATLTLTSESIPVRSVAFSPDEAFVAIAGLVADHAVTLWDVASGRVARRFMGHIGPVQAVAFNRSGALLASGSHDETLRVWEVATGREVIVHRGWRAVHCVAFSPDDALVAAGDAYGGIRVWELTTGRERYSLFGPVDHTAFALVLSQAG